MKKIDYIISWVLVGMFAALAIGSFGSYFFGWRWHCLLFGVLSTYAALTGIATIREDARLDRESSSK